MDRLTVPFETKLEKSLVGDNYEFEGFTIIGDNLHIKNFYNTDFLGVFESKYKNTT